MFGSAAQGASPARNVARRIPLDVKALANASRVVAVGDSNGPIDLFDGSGNLLGQLAGATSPQGLASDLKGDVYVADYGSSSIEIYAAGFQSPPTVLSSPSGTHPRCIDSFSNGRFIATTVNEGSIYIYKNRVPSAPISFAPLVNSAWCAFDASGNLYVAGSDQNGNLAIGEIAGVPKGGKTFAPLSYSGQVAGAAAVQVTTDGHIAVYGTDHTLYVFNPPSGGSLGAPVSSINYEPESYIAGFAFTSDMANVYVSDLAVGTLTQYAYPGGGPAIQTITLPNEGSPIGVAVIPAQVPKKNP